VQLRVVATSFFLVAAHASIILCFFFDVASYYKYIFASESNKVNITWSYDIQAQVRVNFVSPDH